MTTPAIIDKKSSIRTASIKTPKLMHTLQHKKTHIFKIWIPPIAMPEIDYSSKMIFDFCSSWSNTGSFKIISTATTDVISAKVHTQTKRELKALILRFPIQLFSKVQWWSYPTTQLLHVAQWEAFGFLRMSQVVQ